MRNLTLVTRMESTLVIGMGQATEGGLLTHLTPETQSALVLCSQVPGRERWYVNALEDNPRLAAAVELVLRSEEGILDAHANPLDWSGAGALSARFTFRNDRSPDPPRPRVRSHESGGILRLTFEGAWRAVFPSSPCRRDRLFSHQDASSRRLLPTRSRRSRSSLLRPSARLAQHCLRRYPAGCRLGRSRSVETS